MGGESWRRVDRELPAVGVLVETISPGGIQQKLRRDGRLWFTEDRQMYVYYVPEFWRPA